MTGPKYINLTADQMGTLIRLENANLANGGTKEFPLAHLDAIFTAGYCKAIGNNQFLCNASGRHLASAYKQDASRFQLIANGTADPDAAPPKRAPKRKAKA